MKNKGLWAMVGVLLLANAYLIYSSRELQNQVMDMSSEFSSRSSMLNSKISNVSVKLDREGLAMQQAIRNVSTRLENISSKSKETKQETTIVQAKTSQYTIEKTIPIVAVAKDGGGVMGKLTVKLMPGDGSVLINTDPFLEADLQYSANKAVKVAQSKTDSGADDDYVFDYRAGNAQMIGGESAGAAAAVAAIAALENKSIRQDTAITGTIETDGTIGKIAGQMEKAKAVADAGYKRFLIPVGQSTVSYYEKQTTKQPGRSGTTVSKTSYVLKTVDLKETAKSDWGLEIIEVADIDEALENILS